MITKDYSLLEAIKPKISPKAYKELVRCIEYKENQKRLKEIGFDLDDEGLENV